MSLAWNPSLFHASGGLFSFNSERKEEKTAAKNYVLDFLARLHMVIIMPK